ncbi:hypothetical protein AYO38_11340 [bacterium SCGC AG-212-C10]|nr:hypothetical protein AYO38_11340 [bacterium SCGC AG-212-C10]
MLFLGCTYAGHKTRFANLRRHVATDERIEPTFRPVEGWNDNGLIERMTWAPKPVRGRARAVVSARAFAAIPRPDVLWSAASEVLLPHLWAQTGPLSRPLILDLDWTLAQQEELAPIYFGREPKKGLRRTFAEMQERAVFSRVSLFTPWSRWAADGLRERGVEERRIVELPPGIDLDEWQPRPELSAPGEPGPLRVLFVGGDFARKGGEILLEVAAAMKDEIVVDIVTRDDVSPRPGVRVHRAEANTPELHALYASADIFVLPTRAECFGIATIEAMASALPVIVGDVGGARSIVSDGVNGWLIRPNAEGLAGALREALANRPRLIEMGAAGRRRAERSFDGSRNDNAIVELALSLASGSPVLTPAESRI